VREGNGVGAGMLRGFEQELITYFNVINYEKKKKKEKFALPRYVRSE
jgi:hypothetical protein